MDTATREENNKMELKHFIDFYTMISARLSRLWFAYTMQKYFTAFLWVAGFCLVYVKDASLYFTSRGHFWCENDF